MAAKRFYLSAFDVAQAANLHLYSTRPACRAQVGFRASGDGEFAQMCSTLDDQGLLRVAAGGPPRRRRVTLAVQEDDVLLALKDVRVLRNLLD